MEWNISFCLLQTYPFFPIFCIWSVFTARYTTLDHYYQNNLVYRYIHTNTHIYLYIFIFLLNLEIIYFLNSLLLFMPFIFKKHYLFCEHTIISILLFQSQALQNFFQRIAITYIHIFWKYKITKTLTIISLNCSKIIFVLLRVKKGSKVYVEKDATLFLCSCVLSLARTRIRDDHY